MLGFQLRIPRTPLTKMIAVVIVFIVIIGSIKALQIYQAIQKGQAFAHRPPETVTVTRAIKKDWYPTLVSIGTLEAVNGVDLTPETSGIVKKILFNPGSSVHTGDPLVQLDTGVLEAQVKEAQAKLNLSQLNYNRAKSLLENQATSASSLDESEANYQASQAHAEQIQTLLDQKTIKAPFEGQVGLRHIHLGQFISPTTVITSLQSIDPIHVNFSIAEQNLLKIHKGQAVNVTVSAYPAMTFQGLISVIDSKIDADTKSIQVQAELPNQDSDHLLVPGMFASVQIMQEPLKDQIIIPNLAVSYTLYGNSVFVVTPHDKGSYQATRTFIQTGDQKNEQVVVTKGLKGNEIIIKTGQVKLNDDAAVSFKEIE